MCSKDYLTPFVEVGRALCDGADSYSVIGGMEAQALVQVLDQFGYVGIEIGEPHFQPGHRRCLMDAIIR